MQKLVERDQQQRRAGKPVRLVQRPLGPVVADHPPRPHRRSDGRRSGGGQTRVRRDDDDEEN